MNPMKLTPKTALLALAASTILTGCQFGAAKPDSPAPQENSQISQSLNTSDAATFVSDNRAFGIDLYKILTSGDNTDKNLLISPNSIASTVAMVYAGARENTATQIARAAHFNLPESSLHQAFAALDADLSKRSKKPADAGTPFQLEIVNTPWLDTHYTFQPEYLDLLAKNYNTTPETVDFQSNPDAARDKINTFIANKTNQRITDLLPPGVVGTDTKLVLTNAIYFKANWAYPFSEAATKPGTFNLMDGSTTEVPMMQDRGAHRYAKTDGHQVIELPYAGHDVSMIVILPKGDLPGFEKKLTPQTIDRLISNLGSENGLITMPKFSYPSESDLKPALKSLGMTDAFDTSANFSGIDGTQSLFVSDVLHKSFIAVDEQGTEAAAATAAVMGITSAPMGGFEMNLDRPFLYLIYDRPTSTILFMGRLTDPSN